MIIVVDRNEDAYPVTLEDPHDFRRFDVRVCGVDAEGVRSALQSLAEIRGDHAFVEPAGLVLLPGARPEDSEWMKQFHAMVDYAAPRGWVDAAGRIRAHIVWT